MKLGPNQKKNPSDKNLYLKVFRSILSSIERQLLFMKTISGSLQYFSKKEHNKKLSKPFQTPILIKRGLLFDIFCKFFQISHIPSDNKVGFPLELRQYKNAAIG